MFKGKMGGSVKIQTVLTATTTTDLQKIKIMRNIESECMVPILV